MLRNIHSLVVLCFASLAFGVLVVDAQGLLNDLDAPDIIGITINVDTDVDEFNNSGSGTGCSLREAIKTANDDANFGGCTRNGISGAETILLPGGNASPITYTLTITGYDDIDVKGDLDIRDSVTLSATSAFRPSVDGNFALADSLFHVVTGTVLFNGIDIQRGGPSSIGGLYIAGGKVTLEGVTVSRNLGTGIFNSAVLTLSHSVVMSNSTTTSNGAGIYNFSQLNLLQSRVLSNTTTAAFPNGFGGGIYSDNGSQSTGMYITNTEISANFASQGGGGIYSRDVTFSFYYSTLANNSAAGDGGGLYVDYPDFYVGGILNSTISGNRSNGSGGGIYLVGVDSTLATNLTLDSVTMTGNTADADQNNFGNGGGIMNSGPDLLAIGSTLVAGNFDKNTNPQPDCGGVAWSNNGYNLIGNNRNCAFPLTNHNQVGTNSNPIDPQLGPLKNNGGRTPTHALLLGSPAINTSLPSGCQPVDQRGVKRPQGSACDIGAYEGIFVYLPLVLKNI